MEDLYNNQVSMLQASCGTKVGCLPRAANPCVFVTGFSEREGFIHIPLGFFPTPQLRSPNCKGQHENHDPSCTPQEGKERSAVADGGESRQMGNNAFFQF